MRFALSALSNPITWWVRDTLSEFRATIEAAGHSLDVRATRLPVLAGRVDPRERADLVTALFVDDDVDAIIDVSGGDLANETLDFLDYEAIRANPKPFAGYSDISVVLLALHEYAELRPTWWHADRVLTRGCEELSDLGRGERFIPTDVSVETPHTDADALIVRALSQPVLGGNIRCIAKLAGTTYWPSLPEGSTRFLEARNLDAYAVATYLTQLRHAGFFDGAGAILLGQFTKLDAQGNHATVVELVRENLALIESTTDLPILHAPHVGHSADAEPLTIG